MRLRLIVLEPRWMLVAAFFVAGIFLGGLGLYLWVGLGSPIAAFKIHPAGTKYQHINPLLAVDLYENRQTPQSKELERKFEGLIHRGKQSGALVSAAVYFRDIEPGIWTGVDENTAFSPGKLLKIPIMITYYKLAESDPELLEEKVVFQGTKIHPQPVFAVTQPLVAGQTYTVDELIRHMIVFSDDQAAEILFDKVDARTLNEIFSDLGIDFQENKETTDFISLKLYSLFFRVLYNATYLDREYSEKALELLVEADNSIGLGASLPKSVPIANRLGARRYQENGKVLYEMYDCGIIYYPSHPYLLCAVSRGARLESIKDFMSELGQSVYADISYKYR